MQMRMQYPHVFVRVHFTLWEAIALSVLTLLAGRHEEHQACKNFE